jgi:hypothetical protein
MPLTGEYNTISFGLNIETMKRLTSTAHTFNMYAMTTCLRCMLIAPRQFIRKTNSDQKNMEFAALEAARIVEWGPNHNDSRIDFDSAVPLGSPFMPSMYYW